MQSKIKIYPEKVIKQINPIENHTILIQFHNWSPNEKIVIVSSFNTNSQWPKSPLAYPYLGHGQIYSHGGEIWMI